MIDGADEIRRRDAEYAGCGWALRMRKGEGEVTRLKEGHAGGWRWGWVWVWDNADMRKAGKETTKREE